MDPDDIRAVMTTLGLSQKELADLMEPPVNQGTVSRWLAGRQEPRGRHLLQLRRLAGIPDDRVIPSREQAVADWQAVLAQSEADIDAGGRGRISVGLATQMARLARLTLKQLGATTDD